MIKVGGPSGSFTFSPHTGCPPIMVTFTASATKTEFYNWDFGDGETATGNPVSHTYIKAGIYQPVLFITDSLDGPGDTIRCTVKITSQDSVIIPGPLVDFIANPDTVCSPTTVNFTNLTPSAGVTKWIWYFGDGSIDSTSQNPTHFYAAPGTYSVTLIAKIGNCIYPLNKPDFITIFNPPDIEPMASDTMGCTPLMCIFNVDTTGSKYKPTSWAWNFGDGGTSSLQNPTYVYTTGGSYTVSLTVLYLTSCYVNYNLDKAITVYNSPLADFDFEAVLAGNYISAILFNNKSTGSDSYLWDFGDGGNSTEKNPSHTYNADGVFAIQLIAYSQEGCTDTVTKNEKIYFSIKLPNIFTPGGDGANDYFNLMIPGIIHDFKLTVYDKWGLQVYKSDNYQNDWNGRDSKNRLLDDGTYYYELTYNEKYAWYGWVMILHNK